MQKVANKKSVPVSRYALVDENSPSLPNADNSLYMDWKTLLTGFVGALGGTATALALIGVFGKTLLEHWFKKDFADYEAKLRQDFKRYENKLDAIAARDETRFNYYFVSRADSVKEIAKRANEVLAIVSDVLFQKSTPLDKRTPEDMEALRIAGKQLKEQVNAMAVYSAGVSYIMDEKTDELLKNFYGYVAVAMACGDSISNEDRLATYDNATSAWYSVKTAFWRFVEGETARPFML